MKIAREFNTQASYQSLEVVQVTPVTRITEIFHQQKALSPLQKWGFGLLMAALVVTGIQVVRGGVLSSAKLQGLMYQLGAVRQYHEQAQAKNAMLRDKIELYRSPLGIEEIARDRLDMVSQDEILVRVYPVAVAQR